MFVGAAYAQTIPEAARVTWRGQAAIEMARSPHDLDMAAKEFQEAARLAPAWPEPWYDPWYDLAGIEEKGREREAFPAGAQDVGRPDIAGPDHADFSPLHSQNPP